MVSKWQYLQANTSSCTIYFSPSNSTISPAFIFNHSLQYSISSNSFIISFVFKSASEKFTLLPYTFLFSIYCCISSIFCLSPSINLASLGAITKQLSSPKSMYTIFPTLATSFISPISIFNHSLKFWLQILRLTQHQLHYRLFQHYLVFFLPVLYFFLSVLFYQIPVGGMFSNLTNVSPHIRNYLILHNLSSY